MIATQFFNTNIEVSNIEYNKFPKDMAIFNLHKFVVEMTYDCCSVFTKTFPSYICVKLLIDNKIVNSDFATYNDCMFFYNYANCLRKIHYSLRNDIDLVPNKFEPTLQWLREINKDINGPIDILNTYSQATQNFSDEFLSEFYSINVKPFLVYKDPIIGSLIIYLILIKNKLFVDNNEPTAFLFLSALLAKNSIPPFTIPRELGSKYYELMYDFLYTNEADKIILFLLDRITKVDDCY
ncbi:MAG: hypothetical protein IJT59_06445 [Desulfovibrionaceae bacterium]|nr:hypothetical protein [Desulfovibrionaceae bacterium]